MGRALGIGFLLLLALWLWGRHGQWGYRPPQLSVETDAAQRAAAAKKDPQQRDLWVRRKWQKSGYQITAVAEFSLSARVLLKADFANDRESDLAPVDLTFGWGPMADEIFLKKVSMAHVGRFYRWQCPDRKDSDTIASHSANMHMIPGDRTLDKALRALRAGEVISLSGYLVNAQASDGWSWETSTQRDDTGAGACEVVWVDKLSR